MDSILYYFVHTTIYIKLLLPRGDFLLVSRTVALELEDMTEIQKKIQKGEIKNVSEFVQQAVKNELKR